MSTLLRGLAPAVMVAAIALRTGERRVVEALESAGAIDPEHAIKLPLTNFLRTWHFRRLLNVGAVGETMMQLQYLKVAEYAAYRQRRRRRALYVIPVVLLLGFYAYYRSTHP